MDDLMQAIQNQAYGVHCLNCKRLRVLLVPLKIYLGKSPIGHLYRDTHICVDCLRTASVPKLEEEIAHAALHKG